MLASEKHELDVRWLLLGDCLLTLYLFSPAWNEERGYGESDVDISAAVTILPVTGSAHRIGSCPGSCPHQAVTKEAFPGPSLARCHCYYYFQICGSHRSRACLCILHPAYPSLEPVPMPPPWEELVSGDYVTRASNLLCCSRALSSFALQVARYQCG